MSHRFAPVLGFFVCVSSASSIAAAPRGQDPVVAEPAGGAPEPAPAVPAGLTGDWGGVRGALADHGVTIELSAILEANRVLGGGLSRKTTGHALYDLNVAFDLGRLIGLDDGVVAFDAYATDGHNPSEDVGDLQSFSDISADEVAQIGEVYYEQWFFDHAARVKLGKMDANSEFASPSVMGEGFHSAAAYSPTAFTMVTYPNPSTGALFGCSFDDDLSAKIAVLDGAAARGVATGSNGPSTLFGSPADLFWIAQVEQRWKLGDDERAGGAVLGAWQHTGGDFVTVDGDEKNSTAGFYAAFDQELAREDRGDSVSSTLGVLQFGWADGEIAPVDLHVGAGVTFNGFRERRPDDAIGFYGSWVRFGDDPAFTAGSETAIEFFYKCACTPNVTVRPDLQYVLNPGGDETVDHASVFSVRVELSF